jgi:cellulose synthase/poly-beta-1,6-N-acetylglucosamine synthase-like glycosyltransferase
MSGLVVGRWLLVISHWSLVIGHWSLVFVACGLWLAASYSLLIGFFTAGWYRKKELAFGSWQLAVSVIIAARNEEKHILDLLNDLLKQNYQDDRLEIIIIDDRSADNTSGIVNDFIRKNSSLKINLLKTADYNILGKKAAINLGINHASGEIIITTDADCRVRPGWISSLISSFNDENVKMVFGAVDYFTGNKFSDKFQAMEFLGLVASGAGASQAGHPFICNGANLAYRKDAYLKVNGFAGNEKYISGDDVFLLHKMKKEFGKRSIVFCKKTDAIVKTYPAPGLKKFLDQRIRWASKSKGYKDPLSIITTIIVFSYSLTVLLSCFAGFFDPKFFLISMGLLLFKMITDLPLMMGITGFTGQRRLMRWYILFQVIYPFYIVIAGSASLFNRRIW